MGSGESKEGYEPYLINGRRVYFNQDKLKYKGSGEIVEHLKRDYYNFERNTGRLMK